MFLQQKVTVSKENITYNYPNPFTVAFCLWLKQYSSQNKLQGAELEQHFRKFKNHDFEKQWLSSFAGKAIVCTTKVYLFSKREE